MREEEEGGAVWVNELLIRPSRDCATRPSVCFRPCQQTAPQHPPSSGRRRSTGSTLLMGIAALANISQRVLQQWVTVLFIVLLMYSTCLVCFTGEIMIVDLTTHF